MKTQLEKTSSFKHSSACYLHSSIFLESQRQWHEDYWNKVEMADMGEDGTKHSGFLNNVDVVAVG